MIRRDSKNQILEYTWVLVLILYAAKSVKFTQSFQSFENVFALIIPLLIIGRLYVLSNIKGNVILRRLIIGYILYFTLVTVKYQELHPLFFSVNLLAFTLSFLTISVLAQKFLFIYEEWIYRLACISLVLWVILVFMPEPLSEIMRAISLEKGYGIVDSTILFYTININFRETMIPRNCGFAWEPGAFSCFLALAIFVNLVRTKFVVRGNIKLFVLSGALLSTQSTTGYSIFLLIVVLYVLNQKVKYKIILYPLFIVFGLFMSTLSFMGDKILNTAKDNSEAILQNSIANDAYEVPQRFDAIKIDLVDFYNNPILGYGGHFDDRWTIKLGANIASTSGIGRLLASFGLVGAIFFVYALWKTSLLFSRKFDYKGAFVLFLVFVSIAISYTIIFDPLIMCFWMFGFFYVENVPAPVNLELKT